MRQVVRPDRASDRACDHSSGGLSLSAAPREAGDGRKTSELWLAVRPLEPPPASVLESFAAWAYRLTSEVVLQPDEGVLLEIRGSLKLFAGLEAIKARLAAELERRRWRYRLTTAPTPLAAAWLARHQSLDVLETGTLAGAVGRLPLSATAWPERIQALLRQMGVDTIGDCLRLPRAGFARRIGKTYLDALDRALGKSQDLRTAYEAPVTLHETVEFSRETIEQALFSRALNDMVARLAVKLRRRQAQAWEIVLGFEHLRSAATRTRVRFVEPVHEHERLLRPLLARLDSIALGEPATALRIETGHLVPLEAAMPRLNGFSDAGRAAEEGRALPEFALVECLRGRFGEQCVHGIGLVAEHRPEHAWCRWIEHPPAPAEDAMPAAERPLWLLPQPRRETHEPVGAPFERIETGWWDGQEIRRDYHVVTGPAGQRQWVYWDDAACQWYLHGLFG